MQIPRERICLVTLVVIAVIETGVGELSNVLGTRLRPVMWNILHRKLNDPLLYAVS